MINKENCNVPCLWVVTSYSSINSSNIFMSRFTIIAIDIYVTFVVMYYQFVRTYNTSVNI